MNKDRLFLQYLLSYLSILLIPLFIVFTMIYGRTMHSMKDNILNDNMSALTRVQSVIELQIERLYNARDYLSAEVSIPDFNFESDILKAISIQQKLKTGISLSPFIYDIIYYKGDNGYVIGSLSSSTVENFTSLMYHYKEDGDGETNYRLNQVTEAVCWPAMDIKPVWSNTTRLLTYILPIYSLKKAENHYLIFLLPESMFLTLLHEAYTDGGLSYIVNSQGAVLTFLGDPSLLAQASIPAKQTDILNMDTEEILLDGNHYSVNCIESDQYGWKYISLIPRTRLMKATSSLWYYIFFTAVLSVLVGGGFIFYFMKKNYLPIHTLKEYTNQVMQMPYIKKNDVDTIHQVIQVISAQNKELQDIVRTQEGIYQHHFLINLLRGTDWTELRLKQESKKANLSLDRHDYLSAIFLFQKSIPESRQEEIRTFIESPLPKWMTAYLIFDDDKKMLHILAGFDAGKEKQTLEYLKRVLTILNQEKQICCVAGSSKARTSLKEISCSWQEALETVPYAAISGYGTWLHYDEIKDRTETLYLEYSHLQTAILRKNSEEAIRTLSNMKDRLQHSNLTRQSVQENCRELLFVLEKAFYMLGKKTGANGWEPIAYTTLPEFFEQIAKQTALLCENAEQSIKEQDVFQKILVYIQENSTSYDLTASGIADRFSMSQSYLSQFFKTRQGCTILDYITDLKIEAAKEILATTSLPISQVTEQVGYGNQKSFMRRFKQITGMTPGEYRKTCCNQKE